MIDTTKTVFLSVKFSGLGNSKKVSNSQVECDADKDSIRVSKALLDSPELEAIRSLDGEIRRYLYGLCLPFEAGIHLLPTALIETVESRLTDYRAQRADLVSLFVSAYPRLCEEAARRLRSLYNPLDYPDRQEVAGAFKLSWNYISFATPDTLKLISPQMFEEERAKIAAKMTEAYEEARAILRETMGELVKHLREKLEAKTDGTAKRLHASTLDNLREFLSTFEFRNITDDAELAAIVDQAKELLEPVRVDGLRDSTRYRQQIAADLSRIETAIDAQLITAPRRRMVIKEEAPANA